MIGTLLLLQAAAAAVSPAAREKYEPFRRCLVEQTRLLARPGEPAEAALERGMSKCLAANLASGSAALFAEMDSGATKEEAIQRIARLREEVEREALAGLGAAAPPAHPAPVPVLRSEVREASLHIPDEISPAVMPYMACLLASKGVPLYTEGKKALVQPPSGTAPGSDCTGARAKAAKDADKLLKRRGGRTRAERAAFIENVLVSMDGFAPAAPAPAPETN